jgi:hypothetical protein
LNEDLTYEHVEDTEKGLDSNENHYFKKRNTLTKKLSTITRKSLKKRESIKQ